MTKKISSLLNWKYRYRKSAKQLESNGIWYVIESSKFFLFINSLFEGFFFSLEKEFNLRNSNSGCQEEEFTSGILFSLYFMYRYPAPYLSYVISIEKTINIILHFTSLNKACDLVIFQNSFLSLNIFRFLYNICHVSAEQNYQYGTGLLWDV